MAPLPLPAHWYDGEFGGAASIASRAFRYGDGLFETMRYRKGRFHLLELHLERLRDGCARLHIPYEREQVLAQLRMGDEYLQGHGIDEACARLTVSREDLPPSFPRPTMKERESSLVEGGAGTNGESPSFPRKRESSLAQPAPGPGMGTGMKSGTDGTESKSGGTGGIREQVGSREQGGAGENRRGYFPPFDVRAVLALSLTPCAPWGSVPPPAKLIYCALRLPPQPALAGLKHANRLEQVLAAREVAAAGADEGLLRGLSGTVVCAVSANLFAAFPDELVTPPVDSCGVDGVMRRHVLRHLAPAAGLPARVARLSPADIERAPELFLTNALIGIRSAASCGGHRFTSTAAADKLRAGMLAWAEAPAESGAQWMDAAG